MADNRPWHFKVRLARHQAGNAKFVAWCARTPDLGDGPLDIDPAEEVHAEFGETEAESLLKLKREVGH